MFPIVWRVVDPLLQVLDAVRESGCTLWDIVDAYDDDEDLIAKQCARVDRKPLPRSWPSPSPPTLRPHLSKKPGKRNEIFFVTKFGLADGEPGRFLTLEGRPGVHSCGPQQVPVEVGN
jgi:hypothetical protein